MITKEQILKLHPEMAVMTILGAGPALSKSQYHALRIACRNGGYVEAGTGTHAGHIERVSVSVSVSVSASALRALVRRGHLNHVFGSEGCMAGQLSEKALAKLSTALSAGQ